MSKGVKFDIKAQNKTDTAFNAVKKNLRDVDRGLSSLKKVALGVGAATAGLYAVARGVEAVTKAAMIQRDAEAGLKAVLEATGGAAGRSLDELKKFAAGMQEVTKFGDETTIAAMAMLGTFKNIRGEGFERTTVAAMDMATIMKTDLNSAMVMLGKALNDPIANLGALSKSGVQFGEAQKAMIKDMVGAGDLMEAQNLILQELESQFGGAAEAAGDTFSGALSKLKNTVSDFMEQIGFGITDNEAFKNALLAMKDVIKSLAPEIKELVQKFADWLGPMDEVKRKVDTFVQSIKLAMGPILAFLRVVDKIGTYIGDTAFKAFNKTPDTSGWVTNPHSALAPTKQTGTGPAGLPADGMYYGHKGEIVLNPAQSAAARSGGGNTIINVSPTFMTGDRTAGRAVADEIDRLLKERSIRLGPAY